MANTRYLTTVVENEVRAFLSARHGVAFMKRPLPLTTGGRHEFDAVSDDRSVIASIKSASGRTAGGKMPSGKIKDCIAELYFLTLVDAPQRILVLTSPEFHALFTRVMAGKIASGITVEHLPLPEEIQAQVDAVQRAASVEVFPVLDAGEATATVPSLGAP
jgi:hypothetical protein